MCKQAYLEATICQAFVKCLFATCFTLRTKCAKIVPLGIQQLAIVAVTLSKGTYRTI